jgi:hypothetical protein
LSRAAASQLVGIIRLSRGEHLGVNKRNKKRFEAQQMLTQLNALAHDVIVWARTWLSPHFPKLMRLGIKRMLRDVFHITGHIVFDHNGKLCRCVLKADPLASKLAPALRALLAPEHIAISVGET